MTATRVILQRPDDMTMIPVVTLVPDGENCWTGRAEGDNRGMTKKIQDRWYYFETWL